MTLGALGARPDPPAIIQTATRAIGILDKTYDIRKGRDVKKGTSTGVLDDQGESLPRSHSDRLDPKSGVDRRSETLLAVDKVDPDRIREIDEVRVHGVDRQKILRGAPGREIRCGDTIAKDHDRQGAIILARHPAKPFGAGGRSVDSFGPNSGVWVFVLFGVDKLTAVNPEPFERCRAEIDELEISFWRDLRIDVTG